MRLSLFCIMAMLAAAAYAADTVSVVEDFDGIRVTRSITTYSYDRTLYRTSPDSGVVAADYGSIVALTLQNMRQAPLQKLSISEDLAWIAPTKTITFSAAPDANDGRVATWNAGVLGPGQSVKITYNVDGALNPENAKNLPMPKFSFEESKAVLSAARSVRQGETVRLALSTNEGKPAAGAKIVVNTPSGENLQLQSDAFGRAEYTPVDSGFYTYDVGAYKVDFLPTTQVEQVLIAQPPAAAAIAPKGGEGVLAAIGGIWPIAGALLLVGLVAFALYAYLNTSPKEEEAPEGASYEPSAARQETLSQEREGMKYSVSYGDAQEPGTEEVKEQTRTLVQMRKGGAEKEEAVAQAPDAAREVFEAKKEEHDESLPQWMKGAEESYGGEESVVDDDTIQKTIAELEQLRAQLRQKQEEAGQPPETAEEEPQKPLPQEKKKPGFAPRKARGGARRR